MKSEGGYQEMMEQRAKVACITICIGLVYFGLSAVAFYEIPSVLLTTALQTASPDLYGRLKAVYGFFWFFAVVSALYQIASRKFGEKNFFYVIAGCIYTICGCYYWYLTYRVLFSGISKQNELLEASWVRTLVMFNLWCHLIFFPCSLCGVVAHGWRNSGGIE